jgi:hypothetical protein
MFMFRIEKFRLANMHLQLPDVMLGRPTSIQAFEYRSTSLLFKHRSSIRIPFFAHVDGNSANQNHNPGSMAHAIMYHLQSLRSAHAEDRAVCVMARTNHINAA